VADDRSDFSSETGAQPGAGRKTRPPVIELTATDKTPEEPREKEKAESAAPKQGTQPEGPYEASAAARGPRNSLLLPVLAGVIGLLAGALVLSLIFLFTGEGAKRTASVGDTVSGSGSVSVADAAARERAEQFAKAQSEIEKRMNALEAQVKDLDLAPLKARLDSLESGLKDLHSAVEKAQATGSTANAALLERLAAIEAQVKQAASRPAVANAAEVVALGALQDAIAKGAPFKKELDVVRTMLGDAGASLAPLEVSADSGLPTIAELRRRFSDLAPKLVSAPPPDSGYFAKLWSNARRLIEIRPVGEVAGTSAGAVVARIETRLAKNDLAAALDEAAQLPAGAKAQAADWVSAASRRREADAAVKNLLNAALANSVAERPK
jgi:hypothetical protein